jgi:hypothetical protein
MKPCAGPGASGRRRARLDRDTRKDPPARVTSGGCYLRAPNWHGREASARAHLLPKTRPLACSGITTRGVNRRGGVGSRASRTAHLAAASDPLTPRQQRRPSCRRHALNRVTKMPSCGRHSPRQPCRTFCNSNSRQRGTRRTPIPRSSAAQHQCGQASNASCSWGLESCLVATNHETSGPFHGSSQAAWRERIVRGW